MVAPQYSWEQFQSPQKTQIQSDIQEAEQEKSQQPETKSYNWGDFLSTSTYQGPIDPTADEDNFGYLARNLSANVSRLGEQGIEAPGNIKSFIQNIISKVPETSGLLGYALHELMGTERFNNLVFGEGNPEMTGFQLPHAGQTRKISEAITEGSPIQTRPKTPGEERFQRVTEDFGTTLVTGRPRTINQFLGNNLGIPVAANTVEKIVEDLGFGKEKGSKAKLASWIALSLFNANASMYAANQMNAGRNGVPNNVVANVPRYQNSVNNVANNMLHNDPGSTLARQQLEGINRDIQNGQTSVRELMNRYDAINRAKNDRSLFELDSTGRRAAIRNINQVRDTVRQEIQQSAGNYPQALRNWENGVQAFATIHQSQRMTRWIDNTLRGPYAKLAGLTIGPVFGIAGLKYPGAVLSGAKVTAPLAAATAGAYKTGQVAYRIWNDRNLARYYWNAIGAAQAQNSAAFVKNYQELEKAYQKKYGKESIQKSTKKNSEK